MNKRYTKPLSPEELAAMPDAAVDISDIAPLDAAFWQNARVVMPGGNRQVTLRLDAEVLDRFKAGGPGVADTDQRGATGSCGGTAGGVRCSVGYAFMRTVRDGNSDGAHECAPYARQVSVSAGEPDLDGFVSGVRVFA